MRRRMVVQPIEEDHGDGPSAWSEVGEWRRRLGSAGTAAIPEGDCEAAQPRQPRRILVTLERRFLFAPAVIGRLLAVIASQTMS
jgi:hypothetical protein